MLNSTARWQDYSWDWKNLFIFLEFGIKIYQNIAKNQPKSQLQSPSSKIGSVTSQKPKFNEWQYGYCLDVLREESAAVLTQDSSP